MSGVLKIKNWIEQSKPQFESVSYSTVVRLKDNHLFADGFMAFKSESIMGVYIVRFNDDLINVQIVIYAKDGNGKHILTVPINDILLENGSFIGMLNDDKTEIFFA